MQVAESHRVLLRNLARGAAPSESGLDDACLTGLALATPALLAYLGNRDAADLAARSVLQFTHKSEEMAAQAAMWGDLFRLLAAALAPGWSAVAVGSGAAVEPRIAAAVAAALEDVCASFSQDKVDLRAAMRTFDAHLWKNAPASPGAIAGAAAAEEEDDLMRGDEAAFHGPEAIFSLR